MDIKCIQDYFPVASAVMFMISVLVINLVLMNLIIGLAVADIKEIKDNAEFKNLSDQVFQIYITINFVSADNTKITDF